MSANIQWDFREFDATLKQYIQVSSRDLDEICAQKAFDLSRFALAETPKADAAKIKAELAHEVREESYVPKRGKNAGQARTRTTTSYGSTDAQVRNTLGARVVNARRVKAGQSPLWGQKLVAATKALVAARVRSRGFLAAGWLPGLRRAGQLIGKSTRGPAKEKNPKGSVIVQLGRNKPSIEIINSAMNPREGGQADMQAMATAALGRAVQRTIRDMRAYMERKLQRTADRFNAR